MADANKLGKGSLEEICDADLARIALSGVKLEQCDRCSGTGIREESHDEAGERKTDRCHECDGRGALTFDGHIVPETLRAGSLRCKACGCSTLAADDGCDCCGVCGASPRTPCDAFTHLRRSVA